jgi:hypothetical protein
MALYQQIASYSRSLLVFRLAMALLASVLAVFSVWMLLPETARSWIHQLPMDQGTAAAAAAERGRTDRTARFGGLRGDLWAEAAYAYASPLWPGAEIDQRAIASEGRNVIERALAYAPHDAAVWLLAASLASQFDWLNIDSAALLKMCYYTGPNEVGLLPLRLVTAIRPGPFSDSDIQSFVQRDVRMILTRWPELKPAVIAAYRVADPATKRFLEGAAAETDAAFAQILRARVRF